MIEWTAKKLLIVTLWAAWALGQAIKGALYPADPRLDPDYASPVMRQAVTAPVTPGSAQPDRTVFS